MSLGHPVQSSVQSYYGVRRMMVILSLYHIIFSHSIISALHSYSTVRMRMVVKMMTCLHVGGTGGHSRQSAGESVCVHVCMCVGVHMWRFYRCTICVSTYAASVQSPHMHTHLLRDSEERQVADLVYIHL